MTKAFAYVRVSGKGQVDGDGFPRQLAAIRGYAKANDIKIVQTFKDEGVSGSVESTDREGFADMMVALLSNGVTTVIIEKLDRLARDLMVQETAIAEMKKNGFTIISVAEPDLMASDPTRILMRQMLGAVAQYDKSQIVLRLRAARMRKRAQTGRCEGAKPYGTLPGEAEIIDRMKAMRSTGMGFDRIADALNRECVKPRRGAKWHGLTVNKILTGKGRGPANALI
jgi:DNA invertase Pin-like site-specific DNA recombinase